MTATAQAAAATPSAPPGRGARSALLAVIAVAALVIAGGLGWLLHGSGSSTSARSTISARSVDAGFARDMAVHHTQAVTMAGYERDNTSDPALRVLATDIETSQNAQVGEMHGWLEAWGLPQTSSAIAPMSWMGGMSGMHMQLGALMPGMATPAQMNRLESSHGKALDILFLQLMIRHHQGGLPMAKYGAEHAQEPYVRRLAGSIYATQSSELEAMEQMLAKLGGHTLPPPTS